MTARRLPAGGAWIDRGREVAFVLDGRELRGYAGDTVASALLANGVAGGFVSPIQGRPRGVMTAGIEEPNAFVEVSAPWFEAIVPATMINLVDHLEVASRAAAEEAAGREGRVLLVDEHATVVDAPEGVEVYAATTAAGLYDEGYVVAHQRVGALDRIHHVRARRVVLAAGAHERPIAFVGNDLPGVMLAGAAAAYLGRFGVLAGDRVVVFTTNHSGVDTGVALAAAGATVTIVDAGPGGPGAERARDAGLTVHVGARVAEARGEERVEAATIRTADGDLVTVEADLVAVSGGWNPAVQLGRAIGLGLVYDDAKACFVPDGQGAPWLEVVGAAAGDVPASTPLWVVDDGDDAAKYIEPQRDQTVADVAAEVRRGLTSAEHVKRATYIGTTIDQGRTSGVLAAELTNQLLGWGPGAQGPTNARPPSAPIPFSALAGLDAGPTLLDPIRTTPMHERHVAAGATFEVVGQWRRAWYYPRPGEDERAAVARECRAVRGGVGVLDASTLGKIDVTGPDAGVFLDRMYTNRMSSLPVGSIRYGLMLALDGMVFDDGVSMRLAEDRFLVTTTTSGAAAVLDRFEEYLQTEWPDLRVHCTSVTEQWAVTAVGGPKARDVVAIVGTDVDLSNEAFPHMTWRDGTVADVPGRLARVSFTGELSYEIHTSAWVGPHVWGTVMAAGETLGVTPYGTETMHVLRAEKGYVIVGQDTDGTVTPDDLGMSWIVNLGKGDFLGKRSLVRPDTSREDRRQLVGLLPEDPGVVLPEGSQLVVDPALTAPPVPMLGHVTSSYRSEELGRGFALALVTAGRSRIGETIYAALPEASVPCEVTVPLFVDPEGIRRDG